MPNLQLKFSELYDEVSRFLGTYGSSGASGTSLTNAKNIVHAGYRKFLDSHTWSFLRNTESLITMSGTYIYPMPDDFISLIGTFQFDDDDAFPPLEERPIDDVWDMRAVSTYSNYPEYFAIRPGKYTKETGQGWEVVFYPTPDAAYTLHFLYELYPPKLEGDNDIPIGYVDTSEALKACCLAEAEYSKDEVMGVQSQVAQQKLAPCIRRDLLRRPKSLGYNADYKGYSAWDIARGSYRVSNVNYNTD